MKKAIIVTIIVWLASILFLMAYSPEQDNNHMLEINRLHTRKAQAFINEQNSTFDETNIIQSIKVVDRKKLTSEQARVFFSGADITENRFVILPVDDTDYFIRYTIKADEANHTLFILLLSVSPIITLFVLMKTQKDILKPLSEMSIIPEQLAKGNFVYGTTQIENKKLHKFLWGLDMLRAKLDEQRDINLGLEKERKTLVASLAHDIKTPLSSIINYGTAIKDGTYHSQNEIQNAVDIILDKATNIERLTNELLTASVHSIEEITLNISEHYLSELFQAIDRTVRNRINLLKMAYHIDPPKNDPIVLADMDRFIEVCDNIIENAIKYGDLGSLLIHFSNEEQHTLISIENTGNPIPEAEVKHIFSSFYRGSNTDRIQGHGLGLYIAKKIMRAMEGDIYAQNTETGVRMVLIIKQMA